MIIFWEKISLFRGILVTFGHFWSLLFTISNPQKNLGMVRPPPFLEMPACSRVLFWQYFQTVKSTKNLGRVTTPPPLLGKASIFRPYIRTSPPLPGDGTHCRCVKIDIEVHDLTYCRCQRYPPLPAMSTDKYKRHS